jgi:integrase
VAYAAVDREGSQWQQTVLIQQKPSTRAAVKSQLNTTLLPALKDRLLSDMSTQALQVLVADWSRQKSAKTVRNLVATLRSLWKTARAWGYVDHDPFVGLVLPKSQPVQARHFALDEVQRILAAAEEPYRTFFWLAAETGMRAGELCGLTWDDVGDGFVRVRQSVWRGKSQSPKTANAVRTFAISPELTKHLAQRRGIGFVFVNGAGKPLDAGLVVKRKLHPLLDKLGIKRAGLHAFRHTNASFF